MNIWTNLAAYSLIETQRLYLRPFLFEMRKILSRLLRILKIYNLSSCKADLAETQYVLTNYFMKKNPLGGLGDL